MRVLVLFGPKGSGKTTIGTVLEERCGVRFLEVESIARTVLQRHGGVISEDYARDCYAAIAEAIDALGDPAPLCIETTGASTHAEWFLEELGQRHSLRVVRVRASAETCMQRIRERDSTRQVPVSEELIREMHRRTEMVEWAWALEIDNDTPLDPASVEQALRPLLS